MESCKNHNRTYLKIALALGVAIGLSYEIIVFLSGGSHQTMWLGLVVGPILSVIFMIGVRAKACPNCRRVNARVKITSEMLYDRQPADMKRGLDLSQARIALLRTYLNFYRCKFCNDTWTQRVFRVS